jgi:hypothetical protein
MEPNEQNWAEFINDVARVLHNIYVRYLQGEFPTKEAALNAHWPFDPRFFPWIKSAQKQMFVGGTLPAADIELHPGVFHVDKIRCVIQNPNKVKNGQLTPTALEARQGHRIMFVFDNTPSKGGYIGKSYDNVYTPLQQNPLRAAAQASYSSGPPSGYDQTGLEVTPGQIDPAGIPETIVVPYDMSDMGDDEQDTWSDMWSPDDQ